MGVGDSLLDIAHTHGVRMAIVASKKAVCAHAHGEPHWGKLNICVFMNKV